MKTDKLFYAIFLFRSRLLSDLIPGLDPSCDYDFSAPVVKETEYRIDGVFTPLEPTQEQPVVFVEAQMQSDIGFYNRFFAEVYVYLDQYKIERPWRGLLILHSRSQRLGNPRPYFEQLQGQVQQFYLEDLLHSQDLSPSLKLMQLLVLEPRDTAAAAQKLLNAVIADPDYTEWLDVIEAILVSKFPKAGLEGVRKMLGIQTENLSHTQFYQDVLRIGQEEGIKLGEERGEQRGEQRGEANIILRLLAFRFGQSDPRMEAQVRSLTTEQLEALSEALLSFQNIEEFQAWLSKLN